MFILIGAVATPFLLIRVDFIGVRYRRTLARILPNTVMTT
jgi:hypothetical protein